MKYSLKAFLTVVLSLLFLNVSFNFSYAQNKKGEGTPLLIAQNNNNTQNSDEDEDDDGDVEDIKINIPKNVGNNSSNTKQSEDENAKSSKVQGKFYSWIAAGFKDDNETYFNFNRLELTLSQIQGNVTFYVRANARYNTVYANETSQDYQLGENIRIDLPEAYMNYEAGFENALLQQWNFVLGLQIVRWGKADELRPTDIISPQDQTLSILEGRNDRKLGRFAIRNVFTFSEKLRFEAIWLPLQRATETTASDKSIFTPAFLNTLTADGYSLSATQMPEKKLSHSDIALKLYFQIFNIDISMSFYNGYDPLPYAYVDASGKQINPFLNRVTMWGFDFERAVAGVVLRGEVAYFSKGRLFGVNSSSALASKTSSDGFLIEKDYIDATIGFDKNDFLVQKLYLNLQYSVNYILDYEDGILSRSGTQKEEVNHSGIWDIYYEWNNLKYKLEFEGTYSFTNQDFMLNPSLQIKIAMQTTLTFGAYLFFGDENTDIGQYKKKSFGYVQLEHLF